MEKTSRVGRPRAIRDPAPGLAPREQILDAAAALFVTQGFGRTSTRTIAEAVGIRQASLYYHFAGKDDILAELLERSVRPSTELAARLQARAGSDPRAAAEALYELAHADAALLASVPHNVGSLYLIPEVRDERFDEFRAQRAELQAVYGRLGRLAARLADDRIHGEISETVLGALLIQVVEVVIPLRRDDTASVDPATVAVAVLRMVGLDAPASPPDPDGPRT